MKIACSEYLSNLLSKKKPFKVYHINNGVDIERFSYVNNKELLRKKLKLPIDKKIFIWVGCLNKRKNPIMLTKIIKKLNEPNNFYIFCGDGPLKQKLFKNTYRLNNILYTGKVDNIEEYLQASDYYISTSLSEGLPMSVLEGLSCGLPVILSNILQHEFLFSYNLNIGNTFNLKKINSFIDAYKNTISESYEQLSCNARLLIKNTFSMKAMAKSYEELYRESK